MKIEGSIGDTFRSIKAAVREKSGRFSKGVESIKSHSASKIEGLKSKLHSSSIQESQKFRTSSVRENSELEKTAKKIETKVAEEELVIDLDESVRNENNNTAMLLDFLIGDSSDESLSTSLGWIIQGNDLKEPLQKAVEIINKEEDFDKRMLMEQKLALGTKLIAARCFVGSAEKRRIPCEEEVKAVAKFLGGNAQTEIEELLNEKGIPNNASLARETSTSSDLPTQLEMIAMGAKSPQLVKDIAKTMENEHIRLFQAIDMREFTRLAWSKPDNETLAPNLAALPHEFNTESNAMVRSILFNENGTSRDLKEAKNMITFYMDLHDSCVENHNYFGALAVRATLVNAAVARLFSDDETLTNRLKPSNALFDETGNYKALTDKYKQDQKSGIPFIPTALFLSRLTFIQEGNEDKVNDAFNQSKMKMLHEQLTGFSKIVADLPTPPEKVTTLIFSRLEARSEKDNYTQSLSIKPRKA